MRRCARCVMPDTRPDIRFDDEGVCGACRAYERRAKVDWAERRERFLRIMKAHRTHPAYDCVIGSSGGKDSHFIVLKALELGLRPLVVTATTDIPTAIGRRNLLNLRELGVDSLEFTPDPVVRRKIMRMALETVGDIEWAEHCAIFGLPLRIAQDMGINVVLYGENPQAEYSTGAGGAQDAFLLDQRWREEYGGLLGMRPSDLVGREGITEADMWCYRWPDVASSRPVNGVFLGQFFEWHGWKNALIAQTHGFRAYGQLVEGNLADYENLDNAVVGIHDYFGWLKYGFSRATVIASLLVRRGMLTRAEAAALAGRIDGRLSEIYVGVPLVEVLRQIGMTRDAFEACVDHFANRALLEKVNDRWRLKEPYALHAP